MNDSQVRYEAATEIPKTLKVDMRLEVVVRPVADVDGARGFYGDLGWRLDIDFVGEKLRVVQCAPHRSSCSIIFGEGITSAAPGSAQGLYLIVSDIVAVRDEPLVRGIEVSELFHDAGGVFHHAGKETRLSGPQPQRRSYGSHASFSDPDGNGWLFQEVTTRLTGHADTDMTTFKSSAELAAARRRAAASHGEHERKLGGSDSDWPAWYADYIVREQTGQPSPT